jgi:hypothetical protein
MPSQCVRLIDPIGVVVARVSVANQGGRCSGTVDLSATPQRLRALFDEFEEVVTGQMLGLVDDVADRIAAQGLKAVLDDESEFELRDLQIFPGDGSISFELAETPVLQGAGRHLRV